MVDFENHRLNNVFMRLNLILAVAAPFSAKRSHIRKVHATLCPVNLNEGALVAHLRIGDESD